MSGPDANILTVDSASFQPVGDFSVSQWVFPCVFFFEPLLGQLAELIGTGQVQARYKSGTHMYNI